MDVKSVAFREDSIVSMKNETFYIVKANEDRTEEVVCRLKCDKDFAYRIFGLFIEDQQKEYRASKGTIKWRQLRLYDSLTGEKIAQES